MKDFTATPPTDDDDWFPDEHEDADHTAMAALLAGAGAVPGDPDVGTAVEGVVVSLGAEDVFVDIGAKSEAMVARQELVNADGEFEVKVGDTVEATVVSVRDGIRLARRIGKDSSHAKEMLGEAQSAGLPVEGRVDSVNKGGFTVILPGNTQAFCPISQIDTKYVDNPEVWIGKTLEFLITELRDRNVVVSRRQLVKREEEEQAEVLRGKLEVGAVLPGRVASLMDYGAFVDLGGLQGLLHISQISHTRLGHPSEMLKVGDPLTVQVLKLDGERISLGMKQLAQDPWESIESVLAVGQRIEGKVVRVLDFGAFIEVAPGIEGLLHVSELAPGRRNVDAKKIVQAGTTMTVQVTRIEADRKRISLARVDEGDPDSIELEIGGLVSGTVERVAPNGLLLRLGPGRTGLVPTAETGTKPGTDLNKEFPAGARVQVEVIAIEEGSGRIRLSRSAALARDERDQVDSYQSSVKGQDPEAGFSSLGDALRGAMNKPDA